MCVEACVCVCEGRVCVCEGNCWILHVHGIVIVINSKFQYFPTLLLFPLLEI